MNINLIQGKFSSRDAIDIITQMIQVKIKYHESHIGSDSNEEDIKFRESKITRLQNDLADLRKLIESKGEKVLVQSTIEIK